MGPRFIPIDRDTPLLLPPDLRDWVPADHLVHFVLDAVDALDLRQVKVNLRGTGSEHYPPHLLLGLLIYSYATGTFGSRRIEQSTYDSVPVRLLAGDTHPDHDTLCTFRRENRALLSESFVKVLQLALPHLGLLRPSGTQPRVHPSFGCVSRTYPISLHRSAQSSPALPRKRIPTRSFEG